MTAGQLLPCEKLPSGKTIIRTFNKDGSLHTENHGYGILDIGINFTFQNGTKIDEVYFFKGRLVSRGSYEKNRGDYCDMPPADTKLEDFGAGLLQDLRKQQRQRKTERERRLAESRESTFIRPTSTNWLRVISKYKSHLVEFASRDWKVLAREQSISVGRDWMRVFGFNGPQPGAASVAAGLEIGYEVSGDTRMMLDVSRLLLPQIIAFVQNPPEISQWQGSIRPHRKLQARPIPAWPKVLPPLIEFLSGLHEPEVIIFNHHQ